MELKQKYILIENFSLKITAFHITENIQEFVYNSAASTIESKKLTKKNFKNLSCENCKRNCSNNIKFSYYNLND